MDFTYVMNLSRHTYLLRAAEVQSLDASLKNNRMSSRLLSLNAEKKSRDIGMPKRVIP